jgi:cell fate (sporulation/competence/biofilm development) regulator YmcA (YheA/YmcA/DUF963 family)
MNNIKNEIDELFDELEKSKLYNDYVAIKKKIENNNEIMNLINEIKRLQKIATNTHDEIIEKEIKESYKRLESYPIYQSYLIIKDELEEELFEIKEQFDNYFKEILSLDISD